MVSRSELQAFSDLARIVHCNMHAIQADTLSCIVQTSFPIHKSIRPRIRNEEVHRSGRVTDPVAHRISGLERLEFSMPGARLTLIKLLTTSSLQ
eukprot:547406-Pelagomonas_calceolata.AAC.3